MKITLEVYQILVPIILIGETGSRLWSTIRKSFPKQFINFSDKDTLFFKTLRGAKQIDAKIVLSKLNNMNA